LRSAGQWVFADLPPGRYDLVLLRKDRVRVEGFEFAPVLEFDPFLPSDRPPPASAVQGIIKEIAAARHYENKVDALFFAGDEKQVRVLVQLLRDKPTSFDGAAGQPIATLRHELWQFTCQYGGWAKERRTRVLDRLLMPRDQLARWTWVWDWRLGGILITDRPVQVEYELPAQFAAEAVRGLVP
jgi:hypothetical protein